MQERVAVEMILKIQFTISFLLLLRRAKTDQTLSLWITQILPKPLFKMLVEDGSVGRHLLEKC